MLCGVFRPAMVAHVSPWYRQGKHSLWDREFHDSALVLSPIIILSYCFALLEFSLGHENTIYYPESQ